MTFFILDGCLQPCSLVNVLKVHIRCIRPSLIWIQKGNVQELTIFRQKFSNLGVSSGSGDISDLINTNHRAKKNPMLNHYSRS